MTMQSTTWQSKAQKLGGILPRARLHPAVVAWSGRRGPARPWFVALSGGADSLCLLLLLWAHWPERRGRLCALHFNHRLRGRAAAADEAFCRRVCAALGVRLRVGRWRRARRRASEEEARAARFAFFARAMRAIAAPALWLGHHQDDIAETMLMRLARGSGTGGLAAPRPVQRVGRRMHLRPLLTLKKAEIAGALQSAGIPWREDGTNRTGAYFRNRIRRDVLPAWQRAAGRDAVAGAALARELLDEDDTALEAWLDALHPVGPGRSLDIARLAGCPRALVRRALHRWLALVPDAGGLVRQGFEDLLTAVVAGRPTRRSLGSKGFAVIRGGRLRFERKR
jgi:tRNA(Ile)-lysidine synthase